MEVQNEVVLLDSMLIVVIYIIRVLKYLTIKKKSTFYTNADMMELLLILISVTALSGALGWTMMAMFTFYVLRLTRMY